MIGFVVVSHHPKIAEGVAELLQAVADGGVAVRAAAGDEGGALGASPGRILEAIEDLLGNVRGVGEVLIFMDLGSSVLGCRLLLEHAAPGLKGRVRLVDAPLVEGAFAAAVAASLGEGAAGCALEAKRAGAEPKLR